MTFTEALQIIHDEYGQDTLVALENIQHDLDDDGDGWVGTEVREAYDVAMGGFRNLFAPA